MSTYRTTNDPGQPNCGCDESESRIASGCHFAKSQRESGLVLKGEEICGVTEEGAKIALKMGITGPRRGKPLRRDVGARVAARSSRRAAWRSQRLRAREITREKYTPSARVSLERHNSALTSALRENSLSRVPSADGFSVGNSRWRNSASRREAKILCRPR